MTTEYDKTANDKRHFGYSHAGEMVKIVGERSFGLEFSDQQTEYWDAIFKSVVYLDDILDGRAPQEQRLDEFQRALNVIGTGELDPELDEDGQELLLRIHETAMNLDPNKLAEVQKHAHSIALLGERARLTTDAHMLGVLALAEGRVTSRLIQVNPETTDSDPTEFNQYLEYGSAYANILDSLIDLKKDHANGLISVEPAMAARVELAKIFTPGGIESVKKFTPSLLLLFTFKAFQVGLSKNLKI